MSTDHAARHYHIDRSRMHDLVCRFPDQVEEAWRTAHEIELPRWDGRGALFICGMGGSAIGGELLRDLIRGYSETPVFLVRGYTVPPHADRRARVVCVSYSGNTEEVIGAYRDALEKGYSVVAVASGGELGGQARKDGVPLVPLPGGLPPRAAIGHLFASLLSLASRWGVYAVDDGELNLSIVKARKLVEKYSLENDPAENRALQLAKRLYGKLPLIYAGDGLLGGVAYRWKTQFNENSKSMAFNATFPELGHNEVMGWESPEKFREDLFLIMLRDLEDHPRVQRRMEIIFEMLEPVCGGAAIVESEGEKGRRGRLSRLFSTLLLGDFTSVYLGVEYGKDPTPIERIEEIKKQLRTEDR